MLSVPKIIRILKFRLLFFLIFFLSNSSSGSFVFILRLNSRTIQSPLRLLFLPCFGFFSVWNIMIQLCSRPLLELLEEFGSQYCLQLKFRQHFSYHQFHSSALGFLDPKIHDKSLLIKRVLFLG